MDLDEAHAPLLAELYASDPGAAFYRPSMLFDQSFVGVVEDGRLLAAAGTHVLSELRGIAAIGAVYTRPSYRGRGLGRVVMTGVLARTADRIPTIGLNVAVANTKARRLYESLGFEAILTYEEAELL